MYEVIFFPELNYMQNNRSKQNLFHQKILFQEVKLR